MILFKIVIMLELCLIYKNVIKYYLCCWITDQIILDTITYLINVNIWYSCYYIVFHITLWHLISQYGTFSPITYFFYLLLKLLEDARLLPLAPVNGENDLEHRVSKALPAP